MLSDWVPAVLPLCMKMIILPIGVEHTHRVVHTHIHTFAHTHAHSCTHIHTQLHTHTVAHTHTEAPRIFYNSQSEKNVNYKCILLQLNFSHTYHLQDQRGPRPGQDYLTDSCALSHFNL